MKRFAGIGWLLLLFAACGIDLVAPEDLPEGFRPPALDTSSWERLVRDDFSYAVPPGFVAVSAVAIDSDALGHARGEDGLLHDYGLYSGEWSPSPNHPISDVREVWTVLGGRLAQLVSYRLDDRYVVRAWWEDVASGPGGVQHLVVRGESATLSARDELLATIHSVRFD